MTAKKWRVKYKTTIDGAWNVYRDGFMSLKSANLSRDFVMSSGYWFVNNIKTFNPYVVSVEAY